MRFTMFITHISDNVENIVQSLLSCGFTNAYVKNAWQFVIVDEYIVLHFCA